MSSPKVGDVLTTVGQLDACPEGTIVRYSDFWVFVRRDDGEWEVTGADSSRTSDEVFDAVDEVTVIWLPPATAASWVPTAWEVRESTVVFPLPPAEVLAVLRTVPPDEVRVTVEKIGADDE